MSEEPLADASDGAGLDGTWSDEADWADYDHLVEDEEDEASTTAGQPVLAVVGRPNVGKSTLVNRLLGRRQAVVKDTPGVTRDRVSYDAVWNGRSFTIVDTGGWDPDAEGVYASVTSQAEMAMSAADAILLVVDSNVGSSATDEAAAKVLRRSKRPVLVVANKVDDQRAEAEVAELWSLGLGQPYPVSALHGRGSGDLLDEVLRVFPETPRERFGGSGGPRRVALVGKPNVGKSSMLNKLVGEQRAVVDETSGTTVDPVDSLVELDGEVWRLVDTAGLRRRVRTADGTEYYASLRTKAAIEAAEVVIVLIDGSNPLTEQDLRIISMVIESGRSLVIAYNKWDLVDDDRRRSLEKEIDRDLVQVRWAERVNVSAETGRALGKLAPSLRRALDSWDQRISTGRINSWISEIVAAQPPPVRGGKQSKIMFATQAHTRPPTLVLFSSGFIEAGYRRFLERRFREAFGFGGSPVRVVVRIKESKNARK
ncbi:ribosome biogenesis GTPase Der [Actinopolyspora halophila]|uniref:ribosome biogenesis GTPase Der n=1 Tax=Actinopolyspora halophila TaxID=1850 RepID=UPI0003646FC6|nr:ribosome biogenesis GTPase Der [Actinopolyspora halophila]